MSVSCPERLHFSDLKRMADSPLHFAYAREHGTAETDDMRLGTAVHSLVLGGRKVVSYEGRRDERTAAWKDFQAANNGAVILKPDQYERAEEMAFAVRNHPAASELLGEPSLLYEQHIDWERNGVPCCSRLDMWAKLAGWICDLKSCRSARPDLFERQAIKMGYHAQLDWYLDAADHSVTSADLGRIAPTRAFIIAVESKPPHDVTVWEATPSALEAGRRDCTAWFERYKVCESSSHWPGYSDAVLELNVEEQAPELDYGDEEETE